VNRRSEIHMAQMSYIEPPARNRMFSERSRDRLSDDAEAMQESRHQICSGAHSVWADRRSAELSL
jgi:hypothetical protein